MYPMTLLSPWGIQAQFPEKKLLCNCCAVNDTTKSICHAVVIVVQNCWGFFIRTPQDRTASCGHSQQTTAYLSTTRVA